MHALRTVLLHAAAGEPPFCSEMHALRGALRNRYASDNQYITRAKQSRFHPVTSAMSTANDLISVLANSYVAKIPFNPVPSAMSAANEKISV